MVSLQRRALKVYEFRRIFKLPNAEEREGKSSFCVEKIQLIKGYHINLS